jgi:hypothetical protein
MLETKYIMGLGQLLKITPYPKWNLWQKRKPITSTMMPKLVIENTHIANNGIVMETCLITMVIDNHRVVIQVQVGKNTIENILLDGGFKVNIII